MGLMFRRRRPLARLAVGAATAGVAYHAGKRAQQDEYDEQASEPYEASQSEPAPPEYVAPAPASTGGARSMSSAASRRCTTPAH